MKTISLYLGYSLSLLSLAVCVYAKPHGHSWRPSHTRSNYATTDLSFGPEYRKRDHYYLLPTENAECCPSYMEIIQPLGAVSPGGHILELFRTQNLTQSFYQISCKPGVSERPCSFINEASRRHSVCVQRYSYTYALVRELHSKQDFRLDYIRVRSGCSCEIRLKKNHHIKPKYYGDYI